MTKNYYTQLNYMQMVCRIIILILSIDSGWALRAAIFSYDFMGSQKIRPELKKSIKSYHSFNIPFIMTKLAKKDLRNDGG